MFAPMTVGSLYKEILAGIELIYDKQEAAIICSILFENKAGISKSDLIRDPGKGFDEKKINDLRLALSRLQQHIPIQYITGEAWFYGMKLQVSPAVLIPRPETEELVQLVAEHIGSKGLHVLDIGTGSGCIPIAISRNAPGSTVTGIDISPEALAVARLNAGIQQAEAVFLQTDFLDEAGWAVLGKYDVITSNPPYIPEDEKILLDRHVTESEPHTALFVPTGKPLLFYEKTAIFGRSHLNEAGKLFMETHQNYAQQVATLFNDEYYSAEVISDINGNERFVIATRRYR